MAFGLLLFLGLAGFATANEELFVTPEPERLISRRVAAPPLLLTAELLGPLAQPLRGHIDDFFKASESAGQAAAIAQLSAKTKQADSSAASLALSLLARPQNVAANFELLSETMGADYARTLRSTANRLDVFSRTSPPLGSALAEARELSAGFKLEKVFDGKTAEPAPKEAVPEAPAAVAAQAAEERPTAVPVLTKAPEPAAPQKERETPAPPRITEVLTKPETRIDESEKVFGGEGAVHSVLLGPDGKSLIEGRYQGVLVRDLKSGAVTGELPIGPTKLILLDQERKNLLALKSGAENSLALWNLENRKLVRRFEPEETIKIKWMPILSVALDHDGRRAYVADEKQRVWVWDLETGEAKNVLTLPDQHTIRSFGPHAKEMRLFLRSVIGGEAADRLYDELQDVDGPPTDEMLLKAHAVHMLGLDFGLLRSFEGHRDEVNKIILDDGELVTASDDRTILVRNVMEDAEPLRLVGHTGRVLSLALDKRRGLVLSGAEDHTVRLWEQSSGREIAALRGHSGPVTTLALSDDGRYVYSGSLDGTVRAWNMQEIVRRALKDRPTAKLGNKAEGQPILPKETLRVLAEILRQRIEAHADQLFHADERWMPLDSLRLEAQRSVGALSPEAAASVYAARVILRFLVWPHNIRVHRQALEEILGAAYWQRLDRSAAIYAAALEKMDKAALKIQSAVLEAEKAAILSVNLPAPVKERLREKAAKPVEAKQAPEKTLEWRRDILPTAAMIGVIAAVVLALSLAWSSFLMAVMATMPVVGVILFLRWLFS